MVVYIIYNKIKIEKTRGRQSVTWRQDVYNKSATTTPRTRPEKKKTSEETEKNPFPLPIIA